MSGIKFDWALRTRDQLRTRDGAGGSGTIPGILRFRGTFDIATPLTAEYPKNTAGAAVNATQVGDGSGMPGPFVQNGDAWKVIGGGGKVGPTGKQTTDNNMIVAIVDNATNSDADWVIFETEENDLIDTTYANALTLITDSALIPGNMYRITDRYNMTIMALNTNTFSRSCEVIVPAFTAVNPTDELVIMEYDLPADAVTYWKDIKENEYSQYGSIVWAIRSVAVLVQTSFGNTGILRNKFTYLTPSMTGFLGFMSNNIINGSLTASGTPTITLGTVNSGSSINVADSSYLGQFTVSDGSQIQSTGANTMQNVNVSAGSNLIADGAFCVNHQLINSTLNISGAFCLSDIYTGSSNVTNVGVMSIQNNINACSLNYSVGGSVTGNTLDEVLGATIDFNLSYKTYINGFSTIEKTFDVTGLTSINFSSFYWVGIAILTSTNPTETVNQVTLSQTLHTVELKPETGLAITFVPTSVTIAVANDIVLETGTNLIIDGTRDERLRLRQSTLNSSAQQVIGAQFF